MIVRESIIRTQQVEPRIPNWVNLQLQMSEIEDETAFI